MHKTKRAVILMEPELFDEIQNIAKESAITVSQIVRQSLKYFLKVRADQKNSKKLKALSKYKVSLKGLEDQQKFNLVLEKKYS
ncbi:MAG: hypothetical protein HQM16_10360 [Deltaproteobacteria bacterium]|nr:hypothetical protein [Deltaproteobacteria bacterium]